MLRGRFGNTSGRPYIEGRLVIPRLDLRGDFSFLVDTGADRTYLMPGDARVLGIDYSRLAERTTALGVGGPTNDYMEPALAVFADEQRIYVYEIQLTIAEARPHLMTVPSLLGRNVLDRWSILYRPADGLLEFEVLSADAIAPIGRDPGFSPQARRA